MSADINCIFCRIVAGQIPAHIVFRNEQVVAFMDIGPLAEGHTLIIPARHCVRLTDLLPEEASAMSATVPALTAALMKVTQAEGCNLLCNSGAAAGQAVDHVHFHLIPRRIGDGLGYRWNATTYPAGRAQQLAEDIRQALTAM